ncbi:MAG: hypothetical protein V1907_03860 [Candidatus Kerfeldbacteria bacterium]
MEVLDTKHELSTTPEPPELPSPHHAQGKNWLFSLAVGAFAMFILTLGLLAATTSLLLCFVVAPITLVFVTVIVHAVADRAR